MPFIYGGPESTPVDKDIYYVTAHVLLALGAGTSIGILPCY